MITEELNLVKGRKQNIGHVTQRWTFNKLDITHVIYNCTGVQLYNKYRQSEGLKWY